WPLSLFGLNRLNPTTFGIARALTARNRAKPLRPLFLLNVRLFPALTASLSKPAPRNRAEPLR
ncbi:MAG TPA: hypothetical protein VII05_06000, partial [Gaiellaceae bacterium]